MTFRKVLSNDRISVVVSMGGLAVLALGLVAAGIFGHRDQSHLFATFTEEHVRMLDMFDNRGQQMAYRVFLVLTGLLAILAWYFRPCAAVIAIHAELDRILNRIIRHSGTGLMVLLFFGLLMQYELQPESSLFILQGHYGIGFLPSISLQFLLMGGCAFATWRVLVSRTASSVSRQRERAIGITLIAVVAVYALGVFLYGIVQRPDFSTFTPELLAGVEWHYAGSVATADRLALGDRIGEISIHAGLLPSLLMGCWQFFFGMLDFGGHIRFIAWLQLAFFLMAVVAYARWYSRRWLSAVMAVLLILPWVVPIHATVLYPNQSAWRFLGLGFSVLALVYLHARPVRDIAWPLGLVAGAALLWNPETGFAVALAYVGFLVIRTTDKSGDIRLPWVALRFATGFVVAILTFFCVIRLAFGYWADPVGVITSFPLLSGFTQGYGGLKLEQIDPFAALIFIHALYVFVRGIVRWGRGVPVSARAACEMALAGLILVWGAYYFKGPHFWNLWSYKFLYGFFVGALLSARWPRQPWRFVYFGRSARLAAFVLIMFPALIAANLLTIRSLGIATRQPPCLQGNVVSGICLPGKLAQVVREKADALSRLNAQEPLLFLSANPYLMPLLTGINQRLQMRDAFSETILKSDFDRLVQNVLSVHPGRILFDDPESPASGYSAHRAFYGRVRAAISAEYVQEGNSDGWTIWRSR